jgi:predicted enzyme related to lactoylglutathione lyase
MPRMERYETGMLCWADLATTDVEGARRFYGTLFDWNLEDMPAGEGGTYTMARKGGLDVVGLSGMMPGMREQGIPPHWTAYFRVEDIDARAGKVEALGGKLVMPPFDVMEAGRMCVLADPFGASLALWQERKHPGAGVMGDPGSLAWVELLTPDPAKAERFYTQLLGWGTETQQLGPLRYTSFLAQGRPTAGMMGGQGSPPSWSLYFATDHCDRTTEKARQLGARVQMEPEDIPGVGRFSMLQDPQGAWFALIQMQAPPK